MTQTVWGDDICPVRTDREKREESVSWASESSVAKYYVTTEQRDGRRDLWAESKVNNYSIVTHFFWRAAKGRSSLPLNR